MKKKVSKSSITTQTIQNRILFVRGQKVILDSTLAVLYGVSTKRLNEQVKRNRKRFPKDFMFQLTSQEKSEVVAICDHLRDLKFSPVLPQAFTEHGVLMAANVLNSERAVHMSIYVIRAFIRLRAAFTTNSILEERLDDIEKLLLEHDIKLLDLYEKIRPLLAPAKTDVVGFQITTIRPGKIG